MQVMSARRESLVDAGRWLRECREAAGLTQEELADAFGGKAQNVSAYELGLHRPSDEKAAAMAGALGVQLAELRGRFGLYVSPEMFEEQPADVIAAIRRDPHLIPEARKHLLNQYALLRRLGETIPTVAEELLELPHAARKRAPRKSPRT